MLGTAVHTYKRTDLSQDICDAYRKDKECDAHGLIPALGFGAAEGAYGIIDAIARIISLFVDVIPYIIMLGLDGLAAVVYLAGGAVSICSKLGVLGWWEAKGLNRRLPAPSPSLVAAMENCAMRSRQIRHSTS